MLETPSIPRYSPVKSVGSDNAPGADNQQERPATFGWRESSETIRQTPSFPRVMRWSPLHGDMQGTASKEVSFRSDDVRTRHEAKFLVG
jgi:hypothetical protein